ncbi:MAG: DUF4276 family protein [bacterium]
MKFILFIEGHTEKKALPQFLKKWLDPKLAKPVGIKTVRFEGWPELVKDTPKKALMHLNGPEQHDLVAVIALIDLYGPTFYPADKQTSKDRYDWAKIHFENKVNHPKFRQFFAVHETEAWLLRDSNLFPAEIKNALPKNLQHPEEINFDVPPAKLLERIYKQKTQRPYKKVVHGSELFSKLDPGLAYKKCPRFKELLNEMLKLAKEVGL